jgi:uncharacterized protein
MSPTRSTPHEPDLQPDDLTWTEALVLRPSPRHGVGVVARQRFNVDDVIERVPLVLIPDEDMPYFRMQGTIMHRYGMPGIPDADRSALMGGFGAFYNHEANPARANATWQYLGGRVLLFIATRTIEPGDEITYDYGEDLGF